MKTTLTLCCFLALTCLSYSQTTGTIRDTRDGQVYKTIAINGKSWMAQNLNYETSKGSYCYNDQNNFCQKYGKLYTWAQTDIACPVGWHVPSDSEWEFMITLNGGRDQAAIKLKEGGSSGFNAGLGGYRTTKGEFNLVGVHGDYWSSTPASDGKAWIQKFFSGTAKVFHGAHIKEFSFSVRCVQD